MSDDYDDAVVRARRDADESRKIAMNSYGAGYDAGYLAGLLKAAELLAARAAIAKAEGGAQ